MFCSFSVALNANRDEECHHCMQHFYKKPGRFVYGPSSRINYVRCLFQTPKYARRYQSLYGIQKTSPYRYFYASFLILNRQKTNVFSMLKIRETKLGQVPSGIPFWHCDIYVQDNLEIFPVPRCPILKMFLGQQKEHPSDWTFSLMMLFL